MAPQYGSTSFCTPPPGFLKVACRDGGTFVKLFAGDWATRSALSHRQELKRLAGQPCTICPSNSYQFLLSVDIGPDPGPDLSHLPEAGR